MIRKTHLVTAMYRKVLHRKINITINYMITHRQLISDKVWNNLYRDNDIRQLKY